MLGWSGPKRSRGASEHERGEDGCAENIKAFWMIEGTPSPGLDVNRSLEEVPRGQATLLGTTRRRVVAGRQGPGRGRQGWGGEPARCGHSQPLPLRQGLISPLLSERWLKCRETAGPECKSRGAPLHYVVSLPWCVLSAQTPVRLLGEENLVS